MDYQVSARKWRPQTFEAVIGQEHVTTSLSNAIRFDKIAQAYLFSGIRGVGKTSLARILAKGINCEKQGTSVPCNLCPQCEEITKGSSVDVVEVDGASNTGVDDVRELRENVKYLPLRGRYKIYIIDEVHMLSNAAFNALLKTLEEPPPHLIFILATTEVHKIPATILSRCQHFTFRRMTLAEIVDRLRSVSEARNCAFSEKGLHLIGRLAEGSMRDGLSVLDQAISFGGEQVSDDDLFKLMGRMHASTFQAFVHAIHDKNAQALLSLAKKVSEQGCDLPQFLSDWLEHLRNLIVAQNLSEPGDWLDLPPEEIEEISSESNLFSRETLQRLFSVFAQLQRDIRYAPQPFLLFEVTLLKSILLLDLKPIESMIERLEVLGSGRHVVQELEKPSELLKVEPQFEKKQELVERKMAAAPLSSKPPLPWLAALAEKKIKRKPLSESSALLKRSSGTENASLPKKTSLNDTEKGRGELKDPLKLEAWEKLLFEIKGERPNIGSYLEEAVLLSKTDQEICLGFSGESTFLMPLLQKESSRTWIDNFLNSYFKKSVKLQLIGNDTSKERPKQPTKPSTSDQQSSGHGEGRVVQEIHPFVQEILDVMGGRVLETKPIINH